MYSLIFCFIKFFNPRFLRNTGKTASATPSIGLLCNQRDAGKVAHEWSELIRAVATEMKQNANWSATRRHINNNQVESMKRGERKKSLRPGVCEFRRHARDIKQSEYTRWNKIALRLRERRSQENLIRAVSRVLSAFRRRVAPALRRRRQSTRKEQRGGCESRRGDLRLGRISTEGRPSRGQRYLRFCLSRTQGHQQDDDVHHMSQLSVHRAYPDVHLWWVRTNAETIALPSTGSEETVTDWIARVEREVWPMISRAGIIQSRRKDVRRWCNEYCIMRSGAG